MTKFVINDEQPEEPTRIDIERDNMGNIDFFASNKGNKQVFASLMKDGSLLLSTLLREEAMALGLNVSEKNEISLFGY